jgi:hypothetical protein
MYVFGFNFPEVAGLTNSSFDNYLETVIYTLAFVGGEYTCADKSVAVGHTRAHINFK